MEVKKVLITGASGFLGGIISRYFSRNHHTMLLYRATQYGGSSQNLIICDLVTDTGLIFQDNFDIVIHCAGKAHSVPRTAKEKANFYATNTQGTINLLKALDQCPVKPKAFIFISTVAVYGLEKGENIAEDSALSATDPYGHSKILAEKAIIEWGVKNNIYVSILRLPLLVGKNPLGNLGAMIKGIKNGRYFSIGKAEIKKSMVLAEDIAKAIEQVAYVGGIYNLTDGHHPSFRALEIAIAKHLGKKSPFIILLWISKLIALFGDSINFILRKKVFPLDSTTLRKITQTLTFSDSKARKAFNWQPNKVLDFYK